MKYKLLAVSTESVANIGDYIQTLASSQFLPSLDGFVQREELKQYGGEESKVIMNGWYMFHPEQWPPSDKIYPLFVAMHFNSVIAGGKLLNEESITYLKKHEPIGCRDKETERMLKEKGVEAYFSGCMTLTLGYRYKTVEPREGVYFVDPPVARSGRFDTIVQLLKSIFVANKVKRIYDKRMIGEHPLRKWVWATKFFYAYRKLFSEQTLLNATYINHQNVYYKQHFHTDEERLAEAERLVRLYARAKLVVTSRIHCALPCLGLDTPMLYVYNDLQKEVSSCRMDGLIQLFNVLHWDGKKLKNDFGFTSHNKITAENVPANKSTWKRYAEELIRNCRSFVGTEKI